MPALTVLPAAGVNVTSMEPRAFSMSRPNVPPATGLAKALAGTSTANRSVSAGATLPASSRQPAIVTRTSPSWKVPTVV